MQKKKVSSNEELYGELGKAFNFTQGDLEANRAGFLSFRQKREHKNRANSFTLMIGLPATILIAIMGFILFYSSQQNPPYMYNTLFPMPVVICMCSPIILLVLVWIMGMMFYHNYYQGDLREVRIEKIAGQIKPVLGNDAQLRVDNEELNSSINYGDYAWGDLRYMVYYLPRAKQIVAIEAIDSEG